MNKEKPDELRRSSDQSQTDFEANGHELKSVALTGITIIIGFFATLACAIYLVS